MDIKAIKDFSSTTFGNVSKDQILRGVSESQARHLNAHGLTAPLEYETKVIREVPLDAGETNPSSSSPADPAPAPKTRKGQKKKGG